MAISLYTSFVILDRTAKACLITTGVPALLRLWTRKWILHKIQLDDWAMIASWLCFQATCALLIWLVAIANDVYLGKAQYAHVVGTIGHVLLASKLLYITCMALLKVSLAAFFLHIFYIYPIRRLIILSVAGLTVLYSIVCIGITAGTCGAYSSFLGASCAPGQGAAYVGVNISWSAFNAAGDMVFSIVAVDALRTVQMRASTKLYALIVLLLGTAGGIFSIVRLVVISLEKTEENNAESGQIMTVVWTVLEMSIGLTATNLACLRPLLRLLRSRFSPGKSQTATSGPVQRHPAGRPSYGSKSGLATFEPLTLTSALDGKPMDMRSKDWTIVETGEEDAAERPGEGNISVMRTTIVSSLQDGGAQQQWL